MINSYHSQILKLIITICLIFFHGFPLFKAQAVTEKDIERSEEYYQKKAIYREFKLDNKLIHEVSIAGLVISDLQLVQLIGDSQLIQSIQREQLKQQLLFGSLTGGGFLLGGGLLFYANANRQPLSILQPVSGIYINGQRFDGNTPAFIAGILGSLLTILGLVFALQFIYELTGLNQNNRLDNKVTQELVDKYNKQLKAKIKAKYLKAH